MIRQLPAFFTDRFYVSVGDTHTRIHFWEEASSPRVHSAVVMTNKDAQELSILIMTLITSHKEKANESQRNKDLNSHQEGTHPEHRDVT